MSVYVAIGLQVFVTLGAFAGAIWKFSAVIATLNTTIDHLTRTLDGMSGHTTQLAVHEERIGRLETELEHQQHVCETSRIQCVRANTGGQFG